MKWFKHFSDAHDNNDLTKLRMKFGAEGYAIYWYCLELIAGSLETGLEITFELKHDATVIGHNLTIDTLKVEEIVRYCVKIGLFEHAGDTITCLKLAKYLEKRNTRNKGIHDIIDKADEIVADVPRQNALDIEVELEVDNTYMPEFEEFWKIYPRKDARKAAFKAWKKLNRGQKEKAMADIGGGRFLDRLEMHRPYGASYINGERWEDEKEESNERMVE